jgi:uroporphyrinogen-III synthase
MMILITRPQSEAEALDGQLAAMGHESISCPILIIKRRLNVSVNMDDAQAIAVTSTAAIRALGWLDQDRSLPIYAVGSATAHVAQDMGYYAVQIGGGDVGGLETLMTETLDPTAGAIIHPRGATVAGDLQGTLTAAGFNVRAPVLYDAMHTTKLPDAGRAALVSGGLDAVLFFSPKTAQTFVEVVTKAGLKNSCKEIDAICLSSAVAEAAAPLPWACVRVSDEPTQISLLALLVDA